MNIPHQFKQISIFLTEDGFIPILKELSASFVPVIEINSISGQESSHQGGDRHAAGSEKKMGMIGNKRPCKTGCFCHGQEFFQTCQKIFPVVIVFKYLSSLDPPDDDVMQHPRGIKSG